MTYRPDPDNLRAHPSRNKALIRQSLTEVGAFRSIAVDGDGVVRAGNATHEEALSLGYELIEIETKPNQLVVVKRPDLTGDAAKRAAFYDNASSDTSYFDSELLAAALRETPQIVGGVLTDDELAAIIARGSGVGVQGSGDGAPIEEWDDDGVEVDDLLAPFPYFGGKARVAGRIWARFGEVENYVEPFCGSAAVLLACPYDIPVRTVNDRDGFICNFWRSIAADPEQVAYFADWPVAENDLFARHIWLVTRGGELTRKLETDPDYFDAKIAGWWVWGCCAWIGTGWCSGEGPWAVEDEQVINGNVGRGVNRKLPHLGNVGRGVNRKLPHLGDVGQGVCAAWSEHIRDYMQRLSDKLRRVRVCCGDWGRVVTPSVTERHGLTAILLDPPYGEGAQEYSAGGNGDGRIAADVWAWATTNGDNPLLRIAVCGYDDGRALPRGWTAMRWKARKGYQATEEATLNPSREMIWFSPHCLRVETAGDG